MVQKFFVAVAMTAAVLGVSMVGTPITEACGNHCGCGQHGHCPPPEPQIPECPDFDVPYGSNKTNFLYKERVKDGNDRYSLKCKLRTKNGETREEFRYQERNHNGPKTFIKNRSRY